MEIGCASIGKGDLRVWTRWYGGETLLLNMSRSQTWQKKIYQICQEIRNIQQTKKEEKHILNKETPKDYYRGNTVSLDTHGGSAMGGIDSDYSTLRGTELGHSSGTPEHYDTPICGASPVPPSKSPTPEAPHTPLLIPGSRISEPSEDVGLGRACSAALSQSPSSCVNAPGESDQGTEGGVATRGESSWLDRRDSREGQEEGEDPDPGPGEGSSDPSGDLGPSSPPPPNDRTEETRCWRKSTLANACKTAPTLHNTNLDNLLPTTSCSATRTSTPST